jgi:hypothetical protein
MTPINLHSLNSPLLTCQMALIIKGEETIPPVWAAVP